MYHFVVFSSAMTVVDMRHSSLILLLVVAGSAMAQENKPSSPIIASAPSKIVAVNPKVHDIALSQTYDHYVHSVPTSTSEDHYLREIPLVSYSPAVDPVPSPSHTPDRPKE
jgi:hypothetical protein